MVVHSFILSSEEVEADWFLWVKGQFGLHSEFWDSQGYVVRPRLQRTK